MRISSGDLRRFFMTRPSSGRSRRFLDSFFRAIFVGRFVLPLRGRVLQRDLKRFNGWLRKDCPVVAEQMVGMNLVAVDQLDTLKIARAQSEVAIAVARHFDQQGCSLYFQRVQSLAERLGLGLLHVK